MKDRILIIGKIPPPIGGVTIHVSRLLEQLHIVGFTHFNFLDISCTSLRTIITQILHQHITHLHTSNPYFQFLTAIFSKLTGKILFITFHGNIGRYGSFRNLLTLLACKYCTVPIVQNEYSELKALKLNSNTICIGAYIPATFQNPLAPGISLLIQTFAADHDYLFCTNASTLSFDRSGREIYGISDLIDVFASTPRAGLIISDSSGQYLSYITSRKITSPNIRFISIQHDFLNILDYADAMIRNTITDGDSISVHEALHKGLVVFATDCVPRPDGCTVYQDIENLDLVKYLEDKLAYKPAQCSQVNVMETLLHLYRTYLGRS